MNRIGTKKSMGKMILGAAMIAMLAGTTGANAATAWQKEHPRRTEVNMRLAQQNRHITEERREGELTRTGARDLRAQDRGLRAEERLDASRDRGHITRGEQRRLNRQENGVSREIGK